jgi:hypothetical protein
MTDSPGARRGPRPAGHPGADPRGVLRPAERGLAGGARVWSHCRFRNRDTYYVNGSGVKRMRSSAKRQCDRTLGGAHHQAVVEPRQRPLEAALPDYRGLRLRAATGACRRTCAAPAQECTQSAHSCTHCPMRDWLIMMVIIMIIIIINRR